MVSGMTLQARSSHGDLAVARAPGRGDVLGPVSGLISTQCIASFQIVGIILFVSLFGHRSVDVNCLR
jgi:hypothetical protein